MSRHNEQGGIPVHGVIDIEIIRKNGVYKKRAYNNLTTFGKSFVLANGMGNVLGVNTAHYKNKLLTVGNDRIVYSSSTSTAAQVGPYLSYGNYNQKKTDGSKICNLLLNSPSLSVSRGLYVPTTDSAELAGYAYADSASSGSLKEGAIAELTDAYEKDNCVVRRFLYGSDLACQFDTIALSTKVPGTTANTGRIVPQFRSVQPIVYGNTPVTIKKVGVHRLNEGYVVFENSLGTVYTLNIATGVIAEGGTTQLTQIDTYGSVSNIAAFQYGNYSYARNGNWMYVYDSTGAQVAYWNISAYYGIIRYNNTFYAITSSAWYPLVVGQNGYLEIDASTSITPPVTLTLSNTSSYWTVGTEAGGYYTLHLKQEGTYGTPYFYITDAAYSDISAGISGVVFSCNGNIYNLGQGEAQSSAWANKAYGLIEYGNLLSFHTLSETLTKNVGDLMYVTYAYTMT